MSTVTYGRAMLVERRPVVGRGLFVDEHHDERKRI